MFVTLHETGEKPFCVFGTNGFHVKAENEKFIAVGLRCRQNHKYENFTPCFGRLRQNLRKKTCRTCSTIIFRHSNNQIIDLWRCRDRCRRHLLNSLMTAFADAILSPKQIIALHASEASHGAIALHVPLVLHALCEH